MPVTRDAIRERRIQEARDHYLSPEGFLDFVRDCGAAPDAEWEPHGRGARMILNWATYSDPDTGQTLYKKKMVLWPRGSFKSQVFDVGLSCWEVARDPNIRIFIGSETGKQARKFLRNVMEIIESKWFEEHFGAHKNPKRWSYTHGFVSKQRTATHLKEPTVGAFGAGEVQTGAHWDLGILDDPVSQENTQTPEAIDKVDTWIGELLAQLDPGSRLLYIGTIHHYNDYSAKKVKKPDENPTWEISRHEWINDDGSLFFPSRLTKTFIKDQKAEMPSRQFYAYYHNKPQSDEEQIFLPDYFRVINDDEIPSSCWTYILTDFAFTVDQKNDRTCFWVVSLDSNRYAYVRDFYVGRWKPADSVRLCCDLWDRYANHGIKAITVEKTTHEELLSGMFEEIRRQTMTRPKIVAISGRSDQIKGMRIESAEPRWREGRIYFAQSLRDQWKKWDEMFTEMTEWPFSAHDDIPDAISDLDKRDIHGKFFCPGPPSGWTAHVRRVHQPSMIDGKFNPDYGYDARKLLRAQQLSGGQDKIWQQPQTPTKDFFRQVRPRPTR